VALDLQKSDELLIEGVREVFGGEGTNPADFLYVFGETDNPEDVKRSTAEAYNKVGETAHLQGNLKRARAIMRYLGYTDSEIAIAGEDAYNY
jgi:dihydroxyacid dehydratase/phosphogluconate dehydratase